jgi:hypothetical protein
MPMLVVDSLERRGGRRASFQKKGRRDSARSMLRLLNSELHRARMNRECRPWISEMEKGEVI